jgi:transcriptional regulator with XRE-family HTH domain
MKTALSINLKQLRVQNKLTQQQVADKVNVSQRAYGFYETGDREPNIQTLTKLAELYNTSTDYLIGRYGNTVVNNVTNSISGNVMGAMVNIQQGV